MFCSKEIAQSFMKIIGFAIRGDAYSYMDSYLQRFTHQLQVHVRN